MEPSAYVEKEVPASSFYSSVHNWNRNLPQEVSALRKQVQGMETEHLRLRNCLNCLSETVKLLVCQSEKAKNYLPQNMHRCVHPGSKQSAASRSALHTEILHLYGHTDGPQSAASQSEWDRQRYDRRTPATYNSDHPHSSSNRPRSAGLPVRQSEALQVRPSTATDIGDLTASIYIP